MEMCELSEITNHFDKIGQLVGAYPQSISQPLLCKPRKHKNLNK